MTTYSPTDAPAIHCLVEGPIGILTIDNPARLNAVTQAMWRDLPAAIARLDEDPAVRVIIIRGAGGSVFTAGADISEFADVRRDAPAARAYEALNASAFRAIRAATKPTIAMIWGPCLGGGLGIAIACDLRLAGTSAIFGIPAARLGLGYPPDCLVDIVEAIGASRAKELLFTARRVMADEAMRIGLVSEVIADEDLADYVATIASTIAANAPLTIVAAKAAIDRLQHDPTEAGLARAIRIADACYGSADFQEGCAAFLKKRAPVFQGK